MQFLIALYFFIGIWALLDEPSSYFQEVPSRLGFDNFVASIPDLTLLNSVLNVYGFISLIFGIFYYLKINSSLINLWNSSKITKFLAKITHFFLFLIILLPLSCFLYPFAFYLMGAEPEKISISTYPMIFFMALGYSLTFGLLVNRAIINMRYHNTSLQTSFVQCLSSLFWLPLFGKDFSAEKQIEDGNANSNKISITSQTEQTSQINNLSEVDYIQVLENVWGLGEKKVHALLKAYPTAQLFLADTDEQVSSKTKSLIGKNTAKKIRFALLNS